MEADLAVSLFFNILQQVITKHLVTISFPKNIRIIKPWMTPELVRCIRNRVKIHRKLGKFPNNEILKLTYKRYRNYCNSLIRKLKRTYEKGELEKKKYPKSYMESN